MDPLPHLHKYLCTSLIYSLLCLYVIIKLQLSKSERAIHRNDPTFVWKASSIPTFTSHHVQLEAGIGKLLQGCLLSLFIPESASHRKLDEASITYQRLPGQMVWPALLQGKGMTIRCIWALFSKELSQFTCYTAKCNSCINCRIF